jgi:uncharacterized protein
MRVYLWEDKPEKREARAKDEHWSPLGNWLIPSLEFDDVFIHDLVSNTVCADLLDYVMRDSYFCNLGISLEYRFLNFLYLAKPAGSNVRRTFVRLWKGRHHAPRRDTMTDLARLLEARYMIAERAYFHHAKIISGAMLGRALQEHILAKLLSEEDLYEHTDDTLIRELTKSKAEVARRLSSAVKNRVLHKVIGQPFTASAFDAIGLSDIEHSPRDVAVGTLGNGASRLTVEDMLADMIDAKRGDVLIYAPTFGMNPKAADMNVRWSAKDMKFRDIDDPVIKPRLAEIIRSHELLWGIHLLASREVAEDQERSTLLREAFEAQFLCAARDKQKRSHEHCERVIRFHLEKRPGGFGKAPYGEVVERIKSAANDLAVTAREGASFKERLDRVLRTFG